MEIEGLIKIIGETEEFGSNGFKKRELVLTTSEQYPQHLSIEFVQDKCAVLDKYNVGQSVKIGINLRGKEWTNSEGEVKHFNSIQGWRIELTNQAEAQSQQQKFEPVDDVDLDVEDNGDGLPF